MIERLADPVLVPASGGEVFVLSIVRAVAPCGCVVFVGRREDDGVGASVARPCSEPHKELMEDFQTRMRKSLEEEPSPRPYVEVADEILEGIMREHA